METEERAEKNHKTYLTDRENFFKEKLLKALYFQLRKKKKGKRFCEDLIIVCRYCHYMLKGSLV